MTTRLELAQRIQRRVRRAKDRKAEIARMAQERARVAAIVALGVCPECGAPLRRNLALTGWWQCAQYGAPGFRADAATPACSWQGFTD